MTDYAEISEDKVKHIAKELRTRKREQDRQAKEAAKAAEDEASDKGAEPDTTIKAEAGPGGSEETEDSPDAKPSKDPEAADGSDPSSTEQAAEPSQPDDSEPMSIPVDGPLEADQIDQLPTLILASPPEPREELEEEGVSPTVTVRILVGKNGRVKRVIVVNGAEVLEEAAVDAAFEFLFEPGKHQGKPREVWMEFPITFTSPGGGGEEEPQ
jgi:TonB family protein